MYVCSHCLSMLTVFIRLNAADGSKITNKRRPGIHAAPNQKNAARIIISVQLCNLHHPDNYDSVSAK